MREWKNDLWGTSNFPNFSTRSFWKKSDKIHQNTHVCGFGIYNQSGHLLPTVWIAWPNKKWTRSPTRLVNYRVLHPHLKKYYFLKLNQLMVNENTNVVSMLNPLWNRNDDRRESYTIWQSLAPVLWSRSESFYHGKSLDYCVIREVGGDEAAQWEKKWYISGEYPQTSQLLCSCSEWHCGAFCWRSYVNSFRYHWLNIKISCRHQHSCTWVYVFPSKEHLAEHFAILLTSCAMKII